MIQCVCTCIFVSMIHIIDTKNVLLTLQIVSMIPKYPLFGWTGSINVDFSTT